MYLASLRGQTTQKVLKTSILLYIFSTKKLGKFSGVPEVGWGGGWGCYFSWGAADGLGDALYTIYISVEIGNIKIKTS